MAIRDTAKKPYIQDRDTNVFVGMDYPLHRSESADGWFAGTSTTIEAVKTNIRLLLSTEKGERLMQPNLGLGLRRYLFEQFNDDAVFAIQRDIVDTMGFWMPFVEIKDIQINMMEEGDVGKNALVVKVIFNITKDPTTLESVQVEIGD